MDKHITLVKKSNELSGKILGQIQEFEDDTGLSVTSVDIERISGAMVGSFAESRVIAVHLTVELDT